MLLPQARVLCSHSTGVEHGTRLTFVAHRSYQEGQSFTYIYVYTSSLVGYPEDSTLLLYFCTLSSS